MKNIRKSNKGFTLVELIIVVAIIAILSAVIAPQYIKYVEKSRQGTDANAAQEIAHACEVASVGNGLTQLGAGTMTVTINASTGAATYANGTAAAGATAPDYAAAVQEIVPNTQYVFKSTFYKGKTITFTISADGVCTWTAGTGGPSNTAPIQ